MHIVILYLYANNQRVVMRVVKMSCIFLRESDYGAFPPCYLRYRTCQLNILDHPKVSFMGLFGRPNSCHSSYDHSYVPYGVLVVHYPVGGSALEGVNPLSPF